MAKLERREMSEMSRYHVHKEFQTANFKRPPLQQCFATRDSHQLSSETSPEFVKGGIRSVFSLCVLRKQNPTLECLPPAHGLSPCEVMWANASLQSLKANLKTQSQN